MKTSYKAFSAVGTAETAFTYVNISHTYYTVYSRLFLKFPVCGADRREILYGNLGHCIVKWWQAKRTDSLFDTRFNWHLLVVAKCFKFLSSTEWFRFRGHRSHKISILSAARQQTIFVLLALHTWSTLAAWPSLKGLIVNGIITLRPFFKQRTMLALFYNLLE